MQFKCPRHDLAKRTVVNNANWFKTVQTISINVGASVVSTKGRSFSLKMQKWANASCKSALSLQLTKMHNLWYSQPRFTCKQQWFHSVFIIRRWRFYKRTVNCSQLINYVLWWILFTFYSALKRCNVAYKSEIDLRSMRSRLNYLKLWLIFSGCK